MIDFEFVYDNFTKTELHNCEYCGETNLDTPLARVEISGQGGGILRILCADCKDNLIELGF